MKPDIHPDNYRTVLFYDSGADQGWLIRSCANTHGKTMVWKDGIEYPLFSLDTSSASHPVYTGKQRNVNIEGRASKFNQRYQSMMSSFRRINDASSLISKNYKKNDTATAKLSAEKAKCTLFARATPALKHASVKRPNPYFNVTL